MLFHTELYRQIMRRGQISGRIGLSVASQLAGVAEVPAAKVPKLIAQLEGLKLIKVVRNGRRLAWLEPIVPPLSVRQILELAPEHRAPFVAQVLVALDDNASHASVGLIEAGLLRHVAGLQDDRSFDFSGFARDVRNAAQHLYQ